MSIFIAETFTHDRDGAARLNKEMREEAAGLINIAPKASSKINDPEPQKYFLWIQIVDPDYKRIIESQLGCTLSWRKLN